MTQNDDHLKSIQTDQFRTKPFKYTGSLTVRFGLVTGLTSIEGLCCSLWVLKIQHLFVVFTGI